MRALLQRVPEARVEVGERVIGEICYGFLLFICTVEDDSEAEAEMLARKIAKLRILRDEQGKMNRSILDVGSKALVGNAVEGISSIAYVSVVLQRVGLIPSPEVEVIPPAGDIRALPRETEVGKQAVGAD